MTVRRLGQLMVLWVVALLLVDIAHMAGAGTYSATEHGGTDANGNSLTGAWDDTLPASHYSEASDRGICVNCHRGHASVAGVTNTPNEYILPDNIKQTTTKNDLCFRCHQDPTSPAPANNDPSYQGQVNYADNDNNPHHASAEMIFPGSDLPSGSCLHCHATHGRDRGDGTPHPTMLRAGYWYWRDNTAAGDLDNSLCLSSGCHDADGPGANVADSYADDGSSVREGHQTQHAGNWPIGTKLPCTLCHNPHNTPDDNPKLLRHDGYLAGAVITTPDDACAFCHVADGSSPKTIEGISVTARPAGHSTSGCAGCHDPHKPDGAGATGGYDCYDCHGSSGPAPDIETAIAKTYHHTVPSTAPSEFDPDSCLYKCHDDHPHSPQADNTNTSTASASNEKQLCFTCHDTGGSAPQTISQTLYNGSAHDYEIAAPGQGWDFSDSSYYRPNCSKCHGNDDPAGPRGPHGSDQPSLLNVDVTSGGTSLDDLCYQCHDTASTSGIWPGQAAYESSSAAHPTAGNLLCVDCHDPHGSDTDGAAGVRNPSLTERFEEYLCYSCHTEKEAEFSYFAPAGKPSHHTVKDSEQVNPTDYHKQGVNGFVSDTFVIECTDCHNPHIVTQTQLVTDPDDKKTLMSVANTPTEQTSGNNWSKDDTTTFCAKCHDGTGGLTASAGIDTMGIRAGTSTQQTGFVRGADEKHESHKDDPTNGPCTYCHDSHGTAGTNATGVLRGANLRGWNRSVEYPYTGKNSCQMPTSEPGGSCHGNLSADDVLVVSGSSIAPDSVVPSQTAVGMLGLVMTTDTGLVTVTQIQVDRTGTGGADSDVSSVEIWRDTAAPYGAFTVADTDITTGGPYTFSGGSVTVDITDQTVSVGTSLTLFVVYDIAASPTLGATLGATLASNTYVSVAAADSVATLNFPITSDEASVGDVVTVTPTDVAPTDAPRSEIIGMEKLVLTTGTGSATWTALKVDLIGTAHDADIASVRVYADTGSGNFDAAQDTLISSGTDVFSAGTVTVSLTASQTIDTVPQTYFIAYEIDAAAHLGETVGASVSSESYFIVTSPDSVSSANFPFQSGTANIAGALTTDTVTVTPTALTPVSVTQGQTGVAMLGLGLATDANTATLRTIRVDRIGSPGADSDVAAVKIYRESGATAGFQSGEDVLVSSGTDVFIGGTVNILLSGAETISTTSTTFYVVYDIADLATEGDNVGAQVSTPGTRYFEVDSPDTVADTNLPSAATNYAQIAPSADTVTVTPSSLAPASAGQGATNVAMLQLSLATDARTATLTAVRVDRAGSPSADADIAAIKIYKESGATGGFQSGEDALISSGTDTFSSGTVDITLSSGQSITTTPSVFYVVYDISGSATINNNVAARVGTPGGTYFTVNSPDSVADTNLPFTSGSTQITAPDGQPPSQVTDLQITSPPATSGPSPSVSLSWTAATDNVGVDHYVLYRSTTGVITNANRSSATIVSSSISGGATSYTDNSLSATGVYYYALTAVDAAANEADTSNNVRVGGNSFGNAEGFADGNAVMYLSVDTPTNWNSQSNNVTVRLVDQRGVGVTGLTQGSYTSASIPSTGIAITGLVKVSGAGGTPTWSAGAMTENGGGQYTIALTLDSAPKDNTYWRLGVRYVSPANSSDLVENATTFNYNTSAQSGRVKYVDIKADYVYRNTSGSDNVTTLRVRLTDQAGAAMTGVASRLTVTDVFDVTGGSSASYSAGSFSEVGGGEYSAQVTFNGGTNGRKLYYQVQYTAAGEPTVYAYCTGYFNTNTVGHDGLTDNVQRQAVAWSNGSAMAGAFSVRGPRVAASEGLTIRGESVAPATVPRGSADVPFLAVRLADRQGLPALMRANVGLRGDAQSSDVTTAKVWLDDGDGAFDSAADEQLGQAPFAADTADVPVAGQGIEGLEEAQLYVCADIAPLAVEGRRVILELTSAEALGLPERPNAAGEFPISSAQGQVRARYADGSTAGGEEGTLIVGRNVAEGVVMEAVALVSEPSGFAGAVVLTAIAASGGVEGAKVAAAEYFVDTVSMPGTGRPLRPLDGRMDGPREELIARIPAWGWRPGQSHAIFVRARDSEGRWSLLRGVVAGLRGRGAADDLACEVRYYRDQQGALPVETPGGVPRITQWPVFLEVRMGRPAAAEPEVTIEGPGEQVILKRAAAERMEDGRFRLRWDGAPTASGMARVFLHEAQGGEAERMAPDVGALVLLGVGEHQPIEWVRYVIASERAGRGSSIEVAMSAPPGGEASFVLRRARRGQVMRWDQAAGHYVGRAYLPEHRLASLEQVMGRLRLNGRLYEREARRFSGEANGVQVELVADPTTALADGVSTVTLSATVRGPDDEPLAGRLLEFERKAGGGELLPLRPVTNEEGLAIARYITGLTADTAVFEVRDVLSGASARTYVLTSLEASLDVVLTQPIRASASGLTAAAQRTRAASGGRVHVSLAVNPPALPADGRSVADVVATVTDENGQPMAGEEVQFRAPGVLGRLAPVSATTDARGHAAARFEAGVLPGTVDIVATHAASRQVATARVSLLAGGVARVELSAQPPELLADGVSTARILVRVTDLLGRPVAGVPVELHIEGARGQLRQLDAATNSAGEVRARLRAGVAPGVVRVIARVCSPVPEEFGRKATAWPAAASARRWRGTW